MCRLGLQLYPTALAYIEQSNGHSSPAALDNRTDLVMLGKLYTGPATLQGQGHDSAMLKDPNRARSGVRAPRRSQTHYEYQLPSPPATLTIRTIRELPQEHQPNEPAPTTSTHPASVVSSAGPRSSEQASPHRAAPAVASAAQQQPPPAVRRPPLPPPRRSYSVMDYEPMPHHHRPSARGMTLLNLPKELHYAIFDFLDPIDSTCFGLAAPQLYAIHRRLHGTVPLSARRYGPNELEWAWHLAGGPPTISPLSKTQPPLPAPSSSVERAEDRKENNGLVKLRVRGQAYCRKCGVCRCELHKHIQGWVGEGLEYCSVKQKFRPEAPEGAKPYCYMSMPKDPSRCGRHHAAGTKVVLK